MVMQLGMSCKWDKIKTFLETSTSNAIFICSLDTPLQYLRDSRNESKIELDTYDARLSRRAQASHRHTITELTQMCVCVCVCVCVYIYIYIYIYYICVNSVIYILYIYIYISIHLLSDRHLQITKICTRTAAVQLEFNLFILIYL